jgi:hypothetical protein
MKFPIFFSYLNKKEKKNVQEIYFNLIFIPLDG